MAGAFVADRWKTRLVDQRLGPQWREDLAGVVDADTICVGVTAYTGPSIPNALEMCREVRRLRKDLPIVWGGIHASLLPSQTVRHPLVDMVIAGEGETTFPLLIDALASKKDSCELPGVFTSPKADDFTSPPPQFIDLDTLPELPWKLLDIRRYLPSFAGRPHLNFQTSRGCPMRCRFCYNTVFNRNKWRGMSVERIMFHLEKPIRDFGIREILFVDDDLFADQDRARRLMAELERAGVYWQCQGIDISTLMRMPDEMLAQMEQSGCRRIALGVESGSPRMRKCLNKPGDNDAVREQVWRLAKHNILVHCTFIAGFPGETKSEALETRDLMFDLMRINRNVRTPFIYRYFPLPGTELFQSAREAGFRPPEYLQDWKDINADDFSPGRWNFPLGEGMSGELLENLAFATRFLDAKAEDYHTGFVVRWSMRLYAPIARFRARRLFFHFFPEKFLFKLLIGLSIRRRYGAAARPPRA
jgi:anaerobic magnesium-protoporphyrin IX monomethyl ester cyclase